jgi:hypothetical protein
MNLRQRIQKAEKATGIDHEEALPKMVISCEYGREDFLPHFPEPIEEWVTLKAQVEHSRRHHLPIIILPDPFAEYEARYGLESGTLGKHALHGKVSFAELLALATGQSQGSGVQVPGGE